MSVIFKSKTKINSEKSNSQFRLKDFVICVSIGIGISLGLLYFLQLTVVSGVSMNPTLNHQDILLLNKNIYRRSKPKKGDVIQFKNSKTEGRYYLKRVIATEGDHLQIKDGEVILNGFSDSKNNILGETEGDVDIVIGKFKIFVMGDNRENSRDSRTIGEVDIKDVTGKVACRVYPFSTTKTVK